MEKQNDSSDQVYLYNFLTPIIVLNYHNNFKNCVLHVAFNRIQWSHAYGITCGLDVI